MKLKKLSPILLSLLLVVPSISLKASEIEEILLVDKLKKENNEIKKELNELKEENKKYLDNEINIIKNRIKKIFNENEIKIITLIVTVILLSLIGIWCIISKFISFIITYRARKNSTDKEEKKATEELEL